MQNNRLKTKKYSENHSLFKLALSLLLITLTIILLSPVSQGYEISLYNTYPWYIWGSLIFVMILGFIILIKQIFNTNVSKFWILGYLIIIFTNVLVLSLPLIRRYKCSSALDVLIHIGLVKDIVKNAHFGAPGLSGENVYPILHLLISEIYFFSGISPELLSLIVPIFFIILYMLSIYLLAKLIGSSKNQTILITLFGSLMSFGYQTSMIFPSFNSFLLLPLIILLYLKLKEKSNLRHEFGLLLLFFLIVYPFIHPGEGTLLLLFALLIIEIVFSISRLNTFFNKTIRKGKNSISFTNCLGRISPSSSNFIILLIIIWFIWIYNLSIFKGILQTVKTLFFSESASEFSSISNSIKNIGMSNLDFLNLMINTFGNMILYLLFAGILSIIVFKRFFDQQKEINVYYKLFLILFIFFIFVIVLGFFFPVGFRGIQRSLMYPIFFATILNGLFLYEVVNNKNKKIISIFLMVFLIVCGSITIFNTYPSPKIKLPNPQVTQMDYQGMGWLYAFQNDDFLIDSRGVSQLGYASLITGNSNAPKNIRASSAPPDHFGYNMHNWYGENIIQNRYYVDNKISRIISQEIFPEYQMFWTFTTEDFIRMDRYDKSSSKLYANGEFWIYLVRPV